MLEIHDQNGSNLSFNHDYKYLLIIHQRFENFKILL